MSQENAPGAGDGAGADPATWLLLHHDPSMSKTRGQAPKSRWGGGISAHPSAPFLLSGGAFAVLEQRQLWVVSLQHPGRIRPEPDSHLLLIIRLLLLPANLACILSPP